MKALVPGSFDPITNGHLDVIERASRMFEEVIVGVGKNRSKTPLFSLEERVALAEEATSHLDNVTVLPFDDLLVHFARDINAQVVVKGLRAITDFEYEFQMTSANYQLDKEIETVFIMSPPQYMYLSSSVVREIASFHGNISTLVPYGVEKALIRKFS